MKRLVICLIVAVAAVGAAHLRAQGTFRVGIDVVSLNVTAVNPTADGYLTVYPTGRTRPLAAAINKSSSPSPSSRRYCSCLWPRAFSSPRSG